MPRTTGPFDPSKTRWTSAANVANQREYRHRASGDAIFGASERPSAPIRSASALRAFIRVAPEVIKRLDQEHADRSDFRAIGRVIAPWGRRIGDLRFETEGAWKRTGSTVDALAKELRLALMYPEGAAV